MATSPSYMNLLRKTFGVKTNLSKELVGKCSRQMHRHAALDDDGRVYIGLCYIPFLMFAFFLTLCPSLWLPSVNQTLLMCDSSTYVQYGSSDLRWTVGTQL